MAKGSLAMVNSGAAAAGGGGGGKGREEGKKSEAEVMAAAAAAEVAHPYDFHVSGPRNLSSPNWKDLIRSSWFVSSSLFTATLASVSSNLCFFLHVLEGFGLSSGF